MKNNIVQCKILSIPHHMDDRGHLGFLEQGSPVPFAIKRIYYLHHLPEGAMRGAHAHYKEEKFITAIHGNFDVIVDDGAEQKTFHLDNPNQGLYVPNKIWLEVKNFSSSAACMVLTNLPYDESDYIRDKKTFLAIVEKMGQKND